MRVTALPPDFYGIEYEINPWMSRARGQAAMVMAQWSGLHAALLKLN
jgi:N-dimethylarginine dimethylaminohydrolase